MRTTQVTLVFMAFFGLSLACNGGKFTGKGGNNNKQPDQETDSPNEELPDPEDPQDSETPDQGDTPLTPGTPATPETPEVPTTPTTPTTPNNPAPSCIDLEKICANKPDDMTDSCKRYRAECLTPSDTDKDQNQNPSQTPNQGTPPK